MNRPPRPFALYWTIRVSDGQHNYRALFLIATRMFPLKNFPQHMVFYLPFQRGIEIIRVVHGSRDLEKLVES